MEWIASAAFGMTGLVKRDLVRLGAEAIEPLQTGGVRFQGDMRMGFAANLWLRTADRVLLQMGRFEARSFDQLFEGIKAIRWADVLPKDARFPVRAQCARSQLMSPSDCQSIAKKAIVEGLRASYHTQILPETGEEYQVDVAIHNDVVTVSLDSSGAALNRRGYRTYTGEAPIRETLAAAMLLSGPWRPSMPLCDPCCGTGTILIEAAFIAADRAPGLGREFASERWGIADAAMAKQAREAARERLESGLQRPMRIAGSDIDPAALELAKRHIAQAGLSGRIELLQKDLRDIAPSGGPGAFVTNPPYGERMGDRKVSQAVARQLGELRRRSPGWSMGVITPDRAFEKAFGRRADRRARFYNGRMECEYMTFQN